MTTRAQLLASLGGPQPEGIAMADFINEVFDRIEALEAQVTAALTGVGFNLPTADPEVEGALYSDTLIVTVSEGAP